VVIEGRIGWTLATPFSRAASARPECGKRGSYRFSSRRFMSLLVQALDCASLAPGGVAPAAPVALPRSDALRVGRSAGSSLAPCPPSLVHPGLVLRVSLPGGGREAEFHAH